MWLTPLQQEFLVANIRNALTFPVCICDEDGNILVFTGPDAFDKERIIKSCCRQKDFRQLQREYAFEIQPYHLNGRMMGYVLAFDCAVPSSAFPFIFSMLNLLLNSISDTNSQWRQDVRTQLANQLAFYDKTNWEILSFMKLLQYSFGLPRCAVLFCLPPAQDDDGPVNFQTAFNLLHAASPHFSAEDIFGPISQNKILVFKSIGGKSLREKIAEAKKYAEDLIGTLGAVYQISAYAFAGSPYVKLEQLHNSFLEAQFLSNNSQFLNKKGYACLTINKYLFSYLSTLLPEEFKEIIFRDYDLALANSKTMEETLEALTTNNNNLTYGAGELGIHRNTILQRFSKAQGALAADPLHNDVDRASMYCYSLFKSQTITWHACVNIHSGNIQQRGLEKFSQLLQQMSDGRMQLNIEVISKAGDYRQLFESACSGKIDCVSVNSGLLFNSLKGWPHILELPFLFDSAEEANYLLNSYVRKEMFPALHAMGAVLAGFWSMGWRYITSNEPIYIPADMQNKRIRVVVFAKIIKEFFHSMGAAVVMANYNDVPEALETGAIDCQENPYSNILAMEFYRKQKFVTELNSIYDVNAVLFSKSAWERLPGHLRDITQSAFDETCRWMLWEAERVNLEARTELAAKGMEIIQPAAEEKELWQKTAKRVYASIQEHFLIKGLLKEKEIYHDQQGTGTLI